MKHRISKKALKALVAHAWPDGRRENIHCIYASRDGAVLVATDGSALLLRHDTEAGDAGMRPPEADRPCVPLDLDACRNAIKLCPSRGVMEIDASDASITIYDSKNETLREEIAKLDAAREHDYVVPYTQVIPSNDRKGTTGIVLNAFLIARMCKALFPSTKGGRLYAIDFSFGSALDPVRLDVPCGSIGAVDDCAWIGILMPVRR